MSNTDTDAGPDVHVAVPGEDGSTNPACPDLPVDDVARRREIARLARSFVDCATIAVGDTRDLHGAGLSTQEALCEIWRELPGELRARVPQDLFSNLGAFLVVVVGALLQGVAGVEDLQRQIEAQAQAAPPGAFQDGMDLGARFGLGLFSGMRRTRHPVQIAIQSAIAQAPHGEVRGCLVVAGGCTLSGQISETAQGGLCVRRKSGGGWIEEHVVDYRDVLVFSRETRLDEGAPA